MFHGGLLPRSKSMQLSWVLNDTRSLWPTVQWTTVPLVACSLLSRVSECAHSPALYQCFVSVLCISSVYPVGISVHWFCWCCLSSRFYSVQQQPWLCEFFHWSPGGKSAWRTEMSDVKPLPSRMLFKAPGLRAGTANFVSAQNCSPDIGGQDILPGRTAWARNLLSYP